MRAVERAIHNTRRTGYDSIPLYIGISRDSLQFSFGLFQKELTLPFCDCGCVARPIRPASPPEFERVSDRKHNVIPLITNTGAE